MDPVSASTFSAATPSSEMGKAPLSTPIKPARTASLLLGTGSAQSDQILTPEKPIEQPRRPGTRAFAFSVTQVRKAALGLQSPVKAKPDRDGCGGDELVSAEEQISDDAGAEVGRKRSSSEDSVNLPEKYETLVQFFNSMVTSIRLLRMKGQMCSFSNICPKVEYLTDRRFTHGHLARLKYVLPEAISIKKVICHNETTSCMQPDLQIILLPGAFEKKKKEGDYSTLTKIFRARLLEYSKEHPEEDDIPEEELPEPFNQKRPSKPRKLAEVPVAPSTSSVVTETSDLASEQQFAVPSHMPQSFHRRFSQKASMEMASLSQFATSSKLKSSNSITSMHRSKSPQGRKSLLSSSAKRLRFGNPTKIVEEPSEVPDPITTNSCNLEAAPSRHIPESPPSGCPIKTAEEFIECDYAPPKKSGILDGTPAKHISTPMRLMIGTPELQTPKRSWASADGGNTQVKKSVKRPLSLDEQAETNNDCSSLKFLPKNLLQSIKDKERKALEDKDPNVLQARRRQQMITCLPKLFDMILLIFQSSKHSVITKQQLMYKIVASHLDIIDRGEVEEQLTLLQELVPDWISGKMASSGDFIFCVDKSASSESVRQRLAEAK